MTDRIEKTIDLKAPIERVWRALTDSAEFGKWFGVRLAEPFVLGQVAKGMITHAGYEHVKWVATIEKMDEPRYFSLTWHPYAIEPGIDYSGEPSTLVEFKLEPIATGTRLVIVESGFDSIPSHRRDEAFRSHDSGWSEQIKNIQAHVE